MDELNSLADALDKVDIKYGEHGRDPSTSSWAKRVDEKDRIADMMYQLTHKVSDQFPLATYLISPSHGRQLVALQRIRFKRDPMHLDLICYMLLNSSSKFLQFHILTALAAILDQCDYRQLIQIQQTLVWYIPEKKTYRENVKFQLLENVKPMLIFSITEIEKNTFWWRDVESKFFNSLAGIVQYRLNSLYIIRNRRLYEQFENYRSKLGHNAQILFVYHGSSYECLRRIAENGFLEPKDLNQTANVGLQSLNIKKLDSGYFGCGIYQGFAADYAILYAEEHRQSNEIMLSAVLPGKSYTVKKGREKFGLDCESGFDSHISPESKEIVLFKSAQILPLFIIRFERAPNGPIVEEEP